MECKDEAAVERQKLVDDGEIENDDEQSNITALPAAPSAPKSVQTPNSPVLSNRVSQMHVFPIFQTPNKTTRTLVPECR